MNRITPKRRRLSVAIALLATSALSNSVAGAAPESTNAPSTGEPPQDVAQNSLRLAEQVKLLEQIEGLQLTPAQLAVITDALDKLQEAQQAHLTKQKNALNPVMPQLQRVRQALLRGQAPDPADRKGVDDAIKHLSSDSDHLKDAEKQAVSAIKAVMTEPQLKLLSKDEGADQADSGSAGGGPQGGFPGGGFPGGRFPGRRRGRGGFPGGYPGGARPQPSGSRDERFIQGFFTQPGILPILRTLANTQPGVAGSSTQVP